MTILVGMVGSDGIILAADQCMVRPASNVGEFDDKTLVLKIEHLPKHKMAYAGVGDLFTARVGRALAARLDDGNFDLESIGPSLENLAVQSINAERARIQEYYPREEDHRIAFEENLPRGLLIVFYGAEAPSRQLWSLSIHPATCHARQINAFIIAGAIGNAARFFGQYFRADASISSLKLLAAHIVLTAHHFDSLMIDGLNVALFDSQGFRLLDGEEKQTLREKSQALDTFIRTHF